MQANYDVKQDLTLDMSFNYSTIFKTHLQNLMALNVKLYSIWTASVTMQET